jgi:hypothetical protein
MKSGKLLTSEDSAVLSHAQLASGQECIYLALVEQIAISDSGDRQRGD